MRNFFKTALQRKREILGFSLLSLAGSSHALTAANNTAIGTAFTDGATSVSATVAGIILIAAVITGLGLIYSWMRK